MTKTTTLSLCMIVKNEEDYLEQCLNSVKDIVDEIIIVDTGSTDSTLEIAEKFGAKIYHFEWVDDFSKARNFSIEKATGEWLLLLDADEALEPKDQGKLIELINTATQDGCNFKIYNYVGEQVSNQMTIHYAFRLLRNNHKYAFKGAIHEQIMSLNNENVASKFISIDIVIYHYGYLDKIVKKKNKRLRNIPIILKQVEENPQDAYHLFNLGNEYLALEDFKKAIEIYKKALTFVVHQKTFTPHLYYRLIRALFAIQDYREALEVAQQALDIYPNYTNIYFLKAMIHEKLGQYTLAILNFNICLESRETPYYLNIIEGCNSYGAYLGLGSIYEALEDYPKALDAYMNAIKSNPNLFNYLYTVARILNKIYLDKQIVVQQLKSCFATLDNVKSLIIFSAILLEEQLYEQAITFLNILNEKDKDGLDTLFLIGKYYFYMNNYELARKTFEDILNRPITNKVLPNIREESNEFLLIISRINKQNHIKNFIEQIDKVDNFITKNVLLQIYSIYNKQEKYYLKDKKYWSQYLSSVINYVDKIIKLREEKLLQETLPIFKYIHCQEAFLELAKLYSRYGYRHQVIEVITQSIQEFGHLNKEAAFILFQQI